MLVEESLCNKQFIESLRVETLEGRRIGEVFPQGKATEDVLLGEGEGGGGGGGGGGRERK